MTKKTLPPTWPPTLSKEQKDFVFGVLTLLLTVVVWAVAYRIML